MYTLVISDTKNSDWQESIVIMDSGKREKVQCKISKLSGGILFVDVDITQKNVSKKRVGGSLIPIDKNLQKDLKIFMEENGLTSQNVGNRIRCSGSTISNFLSNKYEKVSSDVALELKKLIKGG
jgi:hypothetical protein